MRDAAGDPAGNREGKAKPLCDDCCGGGARGRHQKIERLGSGVTLPAQLLARGGSNQPILDEARSLSSCEGVRNHDLTLSGPGEVIGAAST